MWATVRRYEGIKNPGDWQSGYVRVSFRCSASIGDSLPITGWTTRRKA
jgi:hypothetical protein